jgi:hypothetical protein
MHEFMVNILEIAGGIAVSVVLPALTRSVRREFRCQTATTTTTTSMAGGHLGTQRMPWRQALLPAVAKGVRHIWPILRPYLELSAFSLITAVVILAFLDKPITSWRVGFAAGYLWDSTVQKIAGRG